MPVGYFAGRHFPIAKNIFSRLVKRPSIINEGSLKNFIEIDEEAAQKLKDISTNKINLNKTNNYKENSEAEK